MDKGRGRLTAVIRESADGAQAGDVPAGQAAGAAVVDAAQRQHRQAGRGGEPAEGVGAKRALARMARRGQGGRKKRHVRAHGRGRAQRRRIMAGGGQDHARREGLPDMVLISKPAWGVNAFGPYANSQRRVGADQEQKSARSAERREPRGALRPPRGVVITQDHRRPRGQGAQDGVGVGNARAVGEESQAEERRAGLEPGFAFERFCGAC